MRHLCSKGLTAAVWLLSAALIFGSTGPRRFSVTFENARELKPGDAVHYKGVQIGRVVDVALDPGGAARVQLAIDDRFHQQVYREACFRIRVPWREGRRSVEMVDIEGTRTPLQEGDTVKGINSLFGCFFQRAGTKLPDLLDSPQVREFILAMLEAWDMASEAAQDFGTIALERFLEMAAQKWDDLEKRAHQHHARLLREGRQREAEIFWKWFSRLSEIVDK